MIQVFSIPEPYTTQLVARSCAGLGWLVPAQSSMANFWLSKLSRVVCQADFSENSYIYIYTTTARL